MPQYVFRIFAIAEHFEHSHLTVVFFIVSVAGCPATKFSQLSVSEFHCGKFLQQVEVISPNAFALCIARRRRVL